jgi:hypothetical protein
VPNDTFLIDVSAFSLGTILTWVWFVAVLVFFCHWLIASYHWYVFGSDRSVSFLSITVYGAGGLFLLIVMGGILLTL